MDISNLRSDVLAEQAELDTMVSTLSLEQWSLPTNSPGWTVADQIAHLAYFDGTAAMALADPEAFSASATAMLKEVAISNDGMDTPTLASFRALHPSEILSVWRQNRKDFEIASDLGSDDEAAARRRVPWYGPSMSIASFLTARLMETWAHGQDIVDAAALPTPAPTDRLQHIARLGFSTRIWTYRNRKREAPEVAVHARLTAPSGEIWEFGEPGSDETVSGTALDFCLVTTQRRHPDDTELLVTGKVTREWLELAQSFAGPPTDGPQPSTSFGASSS